jgi:hypothetical protein
MSIAQQIVWLFVLAIPIASVAWILTHEEVFRRPRQYYQQQSQQAPNLYTRKPANTASATTSRSPSC